MLAEPLANIIILCYSYIATNYIYTHLPLSHPWISTIIESLPLVSTTRVLILTGSWFGDPHILTLDGLKYTFNGLGEFTMIKSDSFTLQGRMVQATDNDGNLVSGTIFSAIVAEDSTSIRVQFQFTADGNLEVLVDKKVVTFLEDLEIPEARFEETILIMRGTNDFVVTFASGIYMEIKAENGIISQYIIVLPESFMSTTSGLLGNYNGEQSDDLMPRNESAVIPVDSSLEDIHNNFGISCKFRTIIRTTVSVFLLLSSENTV